MSGSLSLAGAVVAWLVTAFGLQATTPNEAGRAKAFGQRPLAFEANRGQTSGDVDFLARGLHHTIYLSPAESVIAVEQASLDAAVVGSNRFPGLQAPRAVGARFLKFTLLGANAEAAGEGFAPLPGRVNYLTGRSADAWATDIPAFGRVQYEDVYPGVDLVYYGNQSRIEYDFVVAPGANPDVIALRIEGADRIQLDKNGDLVLSVGREQLRQHRPVAYQWLNGEKTTVPAQFRLTGQTVTFELGKYDSQLPLIVDPILSYSTFLGAGKTDRAWAVAADNAGNVYVAGDTFSVFKNFPLSGAQTNFGGGTKYGGDAFVAKMDSTGTNFIYFTYLGGDDLDAANDLAIDATGAAYVTGFTLSTNFPIQLLGGGQSRIAGTNITEYSTYYADAFVTKLDANGALVFSTYLGGEVADIGSGIAVDDVGTVFVTGYTDSALVFRVTNEVRTLSCTNYFGTNQVCATTEKITTNVTTVRLLQPVTVTTNVIKVKTSKVEGVTITNQIVEEVVTSTLLASELLTSGFPITSNAFQTNGAGLADMFIARLTPDASALIYSTYLGGAGSDLGTGIAVDADRNAAISGWSNEPDFPLREAIQPEFGGGRDAVAAKFAPNGALIYSTYLGGALTDLAYRVAVDSAGAAYVVGSEASQDFLGTPGAIRAGGVSKTVDAAENWSLSSDGLTHTGVRALAINPLGPSRVYAATPRGVYISDNFGATWQASNNELSASDITAIALDPTNPSTVYAGSGEGIHRSTDSGSSWTNIASIVAGREVRALLVDPQSTSTLYAGTRKGFLVSTNFADEWIETSKGLANKSVRALVLHPATSSLIYAGTDGGVYKSTNGGLNWKAFNTGLANKKTLALAINPSAPDVLLAGTARGVFRTENSGTNWVAVTNGMGRTQVTALQFDPGDSLNVYAATTNGVFKSTNGGLDWAETSLGLRTTDLSVLAIDPTNPSLLYAGARGTNFSGGTNDAFVVKLAPDGTALQYAFTFGGNRTDEAWDVAVDTNGSAFVTGLTLSKNFPVNGATTKWQGTNSGKADAFVVQFDPSGSSNVFSILLGGKKNDFGYGIALDGLGGIYVVGSTESANFPTTNSVQAKHSSDRVDAFITRFEAVPPAPAPVDGGGQGSPSDLGDVRRLNVPTRLRSP